MAKVDQSSSAQAESAKVTEPEGVVQDESSEEDSEATESESELDPTTLGRGKAQLKKKPTKKQKGSDEEDSTYVPPDKLKKLRAKRKSFQTRVIPRRVRAKKTGTDLLKDQEVEKAQSVEIQTAPVIQSQSLPEVELLNLKKEKAKVEAERDALKKHIEELMKVSDEIRMVLIDQEEKLNKMEDHVEDNTKLFDAMQEEISDMDKKLAKMNDLNQTLNQLISELHEA
ncbi:hypothetical protein Hanom_Chr08g00706721 [Helianthus anomalus]